jgi:hypothetical protein
MHESMVRRLTVALAIVALVMVVPEADARSEGVRFCGGDNGCFCGWNQCEADQCSDSEEQCEGFCESGNCNGYYWVCANPASVDDCYEMSNYVVNLCQCNSW